MELRFPFRPILLLLVIGVFVQAATAQDDLLEFVRTNISEVFADEDLCEATLERFEGVDISQRNLLRGYKGALLMGRAGHAFNPIKKLSSFSDGKELLEAAIGNDPQNIELRFLRLTIQTNLPAFLGYNDEREGDKAYVLEHVKEIRSQEAKDRIHAFIAKAEEQGKL